MIHLAGDAAPVPARVPRTTKEAQDMQSNPSHPAGGEAIHQPAAIKCRMRSAERRAQSPDCIS